MKKCVRYMMYMYRHGIYHVYIYIYHIISYHIISYHIISYHVISYHNILIIYIYHIYIYIYIQIYTQFPRNQPTFGSVFHVSHSTGRVGSVKLVEKNTALKGLKSSLLDVFKNLQQKLQFTTMKMFVSWLFS